MVTGPELPVLVSRAATVRVAEAAGTRGGPAALWFLGAVEPGEPSVERAEGQVARFASYLEDETVGEDHACLGAIAPKRRGDHIGIL